MAGTKGKSGRRKQPAAAKKRRGTYRADRDREPVKFDAAVPKPPANLHKRAAEEWKRLTPIAAQKGLLTSADWIAWRLGFEALSTYYLASEQVGDFVHVTDKGYPVLRPEATIAGPALERATRIESCLDSRCLSSSRYRLIKSSA